LPSASVGWQPAVTFPLRRVAPYRPEPVLTNQVRPNPHVESAAAFSIAAASSGAATSPSQHTVGSTLLPGAAVSLSWGRAAMSLARHSRQQHRRKPQRQPDQCRLLIGRAVGSALLGHRAITSKARAHAVPKLTRLPILDPALSGTASGNQPGAHETRVTDPTQESNAATIGGFRVGPLSSQASRPSSWMMLRR
jgi:hypothetical protein